MDLAAYSDDVDHLFRRNAADVMTSLIAATFIYAIAIPLVLGIMTAWTGTTLGKFVVSLRVKSRSPFPLTVQQAVVRELAKSLLLSLIPCFAPIYIVAQIYSSGSTLYDDWLSTDVIDLKPWDLTAGQRNWRRQVD